MKKLVGVINVRTSEMINAPSHCPFCGHELGDLIRHVISTTFEITCEPCGKTCIVMNDSVKM